jgi:WXG100 family type VII secretion target
MEPDIIRAQYDDLEAIAKRFTQQHEAANTLRDAICREYDSLVNGGWKGRGVQAFAGEMDGKVLPALDRLSALMELGAQVTRQVADVFRRAEEEAAALLGGETSPLVQHGNEPPSASAVDYSRYDQALNFMHQKMVANANGDIAQRLRRSLRPDLLELIPGVSLLQAADIPVELARFAEKSYPGGEWDYKQDLERDLNLKVDGNYFLPMRGDPDHRYYYDIWANIHYGYVGSAGGVPGVALRQVGKIIERNDPGDELSVQIGIDLWNQYGNSLTPQQVEAEILKHKDQYASLKDKDGNAKAIDVRNVR